VLLFSELEGSIIQFQNELKETLVVSVSIRTESNSYSHAITNHDVIM